MSEETGDKKAWADEPPATDDKKTGEGDEPPVAVAASQPPAPLEDGEKDGGGDEPPFTDVEKTMGGENEPPATVAASEPPAPLEDGEKGGDGGVKELASKNERKQGSSNKLLILLLLYYLSCCSEPARELGALQFSSLQNFTLSLYCVARNYNKPSQIIDLHDNSGSLDADFSPLARCPFSVEPEVCLVEGTQKLVGSEKDPQTSEWCNSNQGIVLPDLLKMLSLTLELVTKIFFDLAQGAWIIIYYFYSLIINSLQVVFITLSSYFIAFLLLSLVITMIPSAIRALKRIIGAGEFGAGIGSGTRMVSQNKIKVKASSSKVKERKDSPYSSPVSVNSLFATLRALFDEDCSCDQEAGNQNVKTVVKPLTKFKLEDYKGGSEAKKELELVVDFLKNPTKYHELGARMPRGVLLYGPPGTGKTLFARALAGEASVTFIHTCASEFRGSLVGSGARNIRTIFNNARNRAPCILFIDEIDSISKRTSSELHPYANQAINQILYEMDGFGKNESSVIVVGATNRLDNIDKALIRPGRFDKLVHVDLPDFQSRKEILEHYVGHLKKVGDVDAAKVATQTNEYSGAELEHLVNEASLLAVSEGAKQVEQKHLEGAIEKLRKSQENMRNYDSANYKRSSREVIAQMYN